MRDGIFDHVPSRTALGLATLVAGLLATPLKAVQVPPLDMGRHCEAPPCVGPDRGIVLLAGGGDLGDDVWRTYVGLAGGSGARIVVIPTARDDGNDPRNDAVVAALRRAGAGEVVLLHTRDRHEAESSTFIAPLLDATGVWFPGGRPWRLADAYLHTATHRALLGVLARGGVVGGTSAGASILASYLMRGAPEGNHIVRSPGHEEGFGLLKGVAVDQHLIARNREADMLEVLRQYPQLLGIGLDEGAALVVRGDRAEVIGRSRVAVYERGGWVHPVPFEWLDPGEVYDLGTGARFSAPDRDGSGGGIQR